jgi:hypothetical protein
VERGGGGGGGEAEEEEERGSLIPHKNAKTV